MANQAKANGISIVAVGVLSAILAVGKINGLSPFAPAFLYVVQDCLPWAGISALVTLATEFTYGIPLLPLFSLAALLPYFLPYVLQKIIRKPIPPWVRLLGCALHFSIRAVGIGNAVNPLVLLVCGVLTVCFSYVFRLCKQSSDSLLSGPLSETEKAAYLLLVTALGVGLSQMRVQHACLLYAVAGFLIPFLVCVYGKGAGLFAAVALGVGNAFWSYEVTAVALFAFCALASGMFSSSARLFAVAAGWMALTVFELYFAVDARYLAEHLLLYGIGGAGCLLIPRKTVRKIKESRLSGGGTLALRYLINRNRYETAGKIGKLKDIFGQMSAILNAFAASGQKSSELLAQAVEREKCAGCERYAICKANGLPSALVTLSRLTLVKNKATISGLPPLLEKDCIHLAGLVGTAYNRSLEIRKDVVQSKTQNKVKTELAASFLGVRDILSAQERVIGAPIGFDFEREEAIIEELASAGVPCSQVLISLEADYAVTLLVGRGAFTADKLESAVSRVLGVPSVVQSVDDSVVRGWQIATLTEQPLFRLLTGVTAKPKEEGATGDSHAFVKLNEHCVMVALCDGMGSGKKASELSDKAITLIEDFYKAGFSHEMTVSSVNSFLHIDADESFSALDVLVFDRYDGVADLVKMASPPCYIKKKDHTVRVDSSALPLGILGSIKPSVTSRSAEDGDCFVLVSDGVADCFTGDELSAFINNEDARNPQKLSAAIVSEACRRQKTGREDDMTAIVCLVCRQR